MSRLRLDPNTLIGHGYEIPTNVYDVGSYPLECRHDSGAGNSE